LTKIAGVVRIRRYFFVANRSLTANVLAHLDYKAFSIRWELVSCFAPRAPSEKFRRPAVNVRSPASHRLQCEACERLPLRLL
jgi:hypothetical protein